MNDMDILWAGLLIVASIMTLYILWTVKDKGTDDYPN